jgi:hypothetical protein
MGEDTARPPLQGDRAVLSSARAGSRLRKLLFGEREIPVLSRVLQYRQVKEQEK